MAKKVEIFLNEYEFLKQTVAGNALELAAQEKTLVELRAENTRWGQICEMQDKRLDELQQQNEQLSRALAKADYRLECGNCKHNKTQADDECMKSAFLCDQCKNDCHCKNCTDGSNWEWNGGASNGD